MVWFLFWVGSCDCCNFKVNVRENFIGPILKVKHTKLFLKNIFIRNYSSEDISVWTLAHYLAYIFILHRKGSKGHELEQSTWVLNLVLSLSLQVTLDTLYNFSASVSLIDQ